LQLSSVVWLLALYVIIGIVVVVVAKHYVLLLGWAQ